MRTLVRSNNNYYNELPSIFDDFNLLGDLFRKGISRPVNSVPSVNVKETETAYELEVAAPGLSKEDFKIDVDGNTLTISAEKETNKEEKQATQLVMAHVLNRIIRLLHPFCPFITEEIYSKLPSSCANRVMAFSGQDSMHIRQSRQVPQLMQRV